MAGMAAKMVEAYFEAKETKLQVLEENLLRVGFDFNGGSIGVFLQFDDSDTHVHLEGINFMTVPANKYDAMYKVVNECNDTYSHIKFVLDVEHGQMIARDDAIIQLDSCGEECMELVFRMVGVVQDAFPKLMKAVWA